MVKLVVKNVVSGPRNIFVIKADGYWGDMDELFHWEEHYKNVENGLNDAIMLFKMKERDTSVETYEEMGTWLDNNVEGGQDSVTYIPSNNGSMVPNCIENIDMKWYDEYGTPHLVELEKE